MWRTIAGHELRQQLRGPVFRIVFAVSAIMVVGATAIDSLRVGLGEAAFRHDAGGIVRVHLVWSLFYLFTAAAFVADAVLRDEQAGFAALVRATPVRPEAYLFGRFLGGFGAVVACFVSVPVALWASGWAPWAAGPGPAGTYLFGFAVLALPNLFVASALFFGLATATRSMTGCLLGAAGLLTLYGAGTAAPAVLEPFGFAAAGGDVGVLVANRVLWVAMGVAFLAAGRWGVRREGTVSYLLSRHLGFDPGTVRGRPVCDDAPKQRDPRGCRVEPVMTEVGGHRPYRLLLAQLAARTRLEVGQVVATPAFAVLLLLGMAGAAAAAWPVAHEGGSYRAVLVALTQGFRLVPVVVAIFFAGELRWRERERGMAGLVGATSAGGAALYLPKLAALAAVLAGLALATGAAGAWALAGRGAPDLLLTLGGYALPKLYDWLLVAALALFLQAVAPTKLAGWGYMVFYLIGSLALNRLGLVDPLYRYGLYPGSPVPPALSGAAGATPFRVGWGAVAVGMTVVGCWRLGRRSPA